MKLKKEKYQEDFQIWRFLFSRQIKYLEGKVWKDFFKNLSILGLEENKLPDLAEVDKKLQQSSDWSIQSVNGFVPPEKYFGYLSDAKFPVNPVIRRFENLDFAREPDLFHDTFGHLHLLIDRNYSNYLQKISQLSLKFIQEKKKLTILSQFNKWTTEFGLINHDGEIKIYGAGLISSIQESEHVFNKKTRLLRATIKEMLQTPHKAIQLQPQYFVTDSFHWLNNSLDKIASYLEGFNPDY